MKRIFDIVFSLFLFVLFLPVFLAVSILVKATSPGPVIYWSDRVGKNRGLFKMPKFRSMQIGTPPVATHLLENPKAHLTRVGSFLRKTSLDELPQLWSVLVGQMSFVGPRPALFNQTDLIELREKAGVNKLVPGLTGWAQVNGRDELPIPEKVKFDIDYAKNQCFLFDLKILFMTLIKITGSNGVSH
ncbi:sugar transferase [bacterium]|nr:sugar transferase [bacterium]